MLKLTDEQALAVELAVKGAPNNESLKIEALAGSGKTKTLEAIGNEMPRRRCLYLAFNKPIADEAAKRFPRNIECRTSHSLAFRSFGAPYRERLNQKLNGDVLARTLGVYEFHGIQPKTLCGLALETIRIFCQGSSRTIGKSHIPQKELTAIGMSSDADAVASVIVGIAEKTWQRMLDPRGSLPVTHDFYLKLWALSDPRIDADTILLDESQDTNSLLLAVLEKQRSQIIFVGDQYQQLYSWRGAINAMQRFKSKHVAHLTQSFRFGHAVADVANEVLIKVLGAKHPIRGNPAKETLIGLAERPNAILCRTNAECIKQVIDCIDRGLRVHLQGGTTEFKSTVQGIEDLKRGQIPYSPTLSLFTSYDQLVEFSETELGRDLQTTIKLTDEYGARDLLALIEKIEKNREDNCDVTISTGHKAKGREWHSVRLGSDFRGPDSKGYHDEDGNLLYVSVTRAMGTLDLSWSRIFDATGRLVREENEDTPAQEPIPAQAAPAVEPEIPSHPLDLLEIQPSLSEPEAPKLQPGRPRSASPDDIRLYLGRALREQRATILANPEEAKSAFEGLQWLLLVNGNPDEWVSRYMSSATRGKMLTAIRKKHFKEKTGITSLDLHPKAASAFAQLAEYEGRTLSEMMLLLIERWEEKTGAEGGAEGGVFA